MTAGPFSSDAFTARREAMDCSIAVNRHNMDYANAEPKSADELVKDAGTYLGFLVPSTTIDAST